jgi:SagB-type dehydrogenase family enzyme
MDWASQPNPFRFYEQTITLNLDHTRVTESPTYDALFTSNNIEPAPMDRASISRLFHESMAISAWKQVSGNRWSLRVNPSSGDLHPTESYLIAGPIEHLAKSPAVYHYSPYKHALETRLILTDEEWNEISRYAAPDLLLVAFTSIYWRESWKYGERAYRYCHHDVGHAIGTITFAAAVQGWQTRLVHTVTDDELTTLLGLQTQEGKELEHPDCLLAIYPVNTETLFTEPVINFSRPGLARLKTVKYEGRPNSLSSSHHDWPIIDTVAAACRLDNSYSLTLARDETINEITKKRFADDRQISAGKIFRERRSAVAMDASTSIGKETFYRMMAHVLPHPGNNILAVLSWRARISLAIFIHRVDGLQPGLYLLVRDPDHESSLRKSLITDFHWQKPGDCPVSIPLYFLMAGDAREAARTICCHQEIAADGTFAIGMLAEFDGSLQHYGAWYYPRLYWETGLIGQILYLEAEAAGIRSTGIGCFFDDAMHELLGINDHTWQSLYHFTVGGPVDDPRIQTLPSYWHLQPDS